jgi:hypothetical protein
MFEQRSTLPPSSHDSCGNGRLFLSKHELKTRFVIGLTIVTRDYLTFDLLGDRLENTCFRRFRSCSVEKVAQIESSRRVCFKTEKILAKQLEALQVQNGIATSLASNQAK